MSQFMENCFVPVLFNKDTLFIVQHEGQPFVPLRPVVQNLGLDWKSQHAKIVANERRWSVVMITTVAGDGKNREMATIPLRKFFGFLNSIEPAKVKASIRPKLEEYQDKCDEVLWDFWSGQKREDEERILRLFKEATAGYRMVKKAPAPCTPEEIRRLKSEILGGAGTTETARKFGRSRSTVKAHTVAERAERAGQLQLL